MSLYEKIATTAWFTPMPNGWGVPILWTGPAGSAKTGHHYGWARKFSSPFLHLSPGQKGEGYFGVVPVPVADALGEVTLTFPTNRAVKQMVQLGRGLILLDELRAAPQIVGPALLGILQERQFGDEELPPGVRVFAASNSAKESVNGRKLSAPAANRVCHIAWEDPSPSEMLAHALRSAGQDPFLAKRPIDFSDYAAHEEVERRILEARAEGMAKAMSEVFAFTERVKNPRGDSIIRDQPAPGSEASDGPWASPRSWYGVGEILFAYRTLLSLGVIEPERAPDGSILTQESDSRVLRTMVEGMVGAGNGGAFLLWLDEQDIPDYAQWLDGKVTVEFRHGIRDDRTFTIMQGAAAHIVALKDAAVKASRAKRFWGIAKEVAEKGGFELVGSAVAILAEDDPATIIKEKSEFVREYAARIRAAQK